MFCSCADKRFASSLRKSLDGTPPALDACAAVCISTFSDGVCPNLARIHMELASFLAHVEQASDLEARALCVCVQIVNRPR
mmetsp:Transcript_1950/g.4428  ORF Transcript_1950/g.4428 Transcript_1950/m.4428 type:complete len:81 (-) Transcript_1950:797-1039(-)